MHKVDVGFAYNKLQINLIQIIKDKKETDKNETFSLFSVTLDTHRFFQHLDWSQPVSHSIDWRWFVNSHTCVDSWKCTSEQNQQLAVRLPVRWQGLLCFLWSCLTRYLLGALLRGSIGGSWGLLGFLVTQRLFVLSKHAKGDKKLFFLVELLGPGVMTGDAGGHWGS